MVPSESEPSTASPDTDSSTAAPVTSDVISWEGPTYARSRSVVVGCLTAVLAALVVVVGVAAIVVSSSLTVDTLLVGGVLLLVGGPFSLLYLAIAYSESTESDKQAFWRFVVPFSGNMSWLRPGWVGGGALGAVGLVWWLSGITSSAGSVALVFVALSPLVFTIGQSNYRLDPRSDVLQIEFSYGDQTHEQTLAWLVGVRRLHLDSVSLFVCSNQGKRWYEGTHFLVVPESVADSVENRLQRAAATDPPQRIKRDERIIFGVFGASTVAVGPLLYLVSGEPAVLFVLAGPSTVVGLGAILHSFRG